MLKCQQNRSELKFEYFVHLKILYDVHFQNNINIDYPNFESDLSPIFIKDVKKLRMKKWHFKTLKDEEHITEYSDMPWRTETSKYL